MTVWVLVFSRQRATKYFLKTLRCLEMWLNCVITIRVSYSTFLGKFQFPFDDTRYKIVHENFMVIVPGVFCLSLVDKECFYVEHNGTSDSGKDDHVSQRYFQKETWLRTSLKTLSTAISIKSRISTTKLPNSTIPLYRSYCS